MGLFSRLERFDQKLTRGYARWGRWVWRMLIAVARCEQISEYSPLAGTGENPNRKAEEIKVQIAELKSLWGWLDGVRRVSTGLSNNFNYGRQIDTHMENHKDIYLPASRRTKLFLDFYHKVWNGEKLPDITWPGINTLHAYFAHDLQTVDTGASINKSFFLRRMAECPKPQ